MMNRIKIVFFLITAFLLCSLDSYSMKRAALEEDFEPSKEARPSSKENGAPTAFWQALLDGNANELMRYHEFYSKDTVCTELGTTPLMIAAFQGHTTIVKMILACNISVNESNTQDDTALLLAASQGHADIVELLIRRGAHVNVQGGMENTPLILAASTGDVKTVELLIASGAEIDIWNAEGDTALMMAIARGHKDVVNILLESVKKSPVCQMYLNKTNNAGMSAFLIAGMNGYYDIMKQLTAMNSDVIAEAKSYKATFIWAAHKGNSNLIKVLNDLDTGCYITDDVLKEALMIAIDAQHKELVEELLRQGIDINVRGQRNYTPLLWAVYTQRLEMVKMLLNYKPFLDAQDVDGFTALMWAVFIDNLEILRILINAGEGVNIQDRAGNTALIYAIQENNQEAVEMLLAHGADVNIYNNEHQNVFSLAAIHCSARIHKVLAPYKKYLQPERSKITTLPVQESSLPAFPLNLSSEDLSKVQPSALGAYTKGTSSSPVNSAPAKMKRKRSKGQVLLTAVRNGDVKTLEECISKGINLRSADAQAALSLALDNSDVALTQKLLEAGVNVEAAVNGVNSWGRTLLVLAAETKCAPLLSLLIQYGAEVNKADSRGNTALHSAAASHWLEGVKLLLAYGANVNVCDNRGDNALLAVVNRGFIGGKKFNSKKFNSAKVKEVIELLIAKGIDAKVKNTDGKNAFMYAVCQSYLEVLPLLLAHGIDINAQDNEGNTALMQILTMIDTLNLSYSLKLQLTIIQWLLEYKADPYIKNNQDETVLMRAAACGCSELVKLFIAKGVDPSAKSTKGLTALAYAAQRLDKECVELLLKNDVPNVWSPLQMKILCAYAVQTGNLALLNIILTNKFNGNDFLPKLAGRYDKTLSFAYHVLAGGYDSMSLTHYILRLAAECGHTHIVEELINNKAIDIQKQGAPALMAAISNGYTDIIKLLVGAGVTLKGCKDSGKEALSQAVYSGHVSVIEKLQEAGIDVRNSGSRVLLDAAELGRLDTVSALIKAGARLNIHAKAHTSLKNRLLKNHADAAIMHILEISQRPEVKKYLKNSASYVKHHISKAQKYQRDEHGQTLLMWACMFGDKEQVHVLLKLPLPIDYINAQDDRKCTALHYALMGGHYEIARILAPRCGKGINLSDGKGTTSLSYAIKVGNLTLINDLLAAGARPTIRDLQLAAASGHKEILVRLLFLVARTNEGKELPSLFK